MLSAALLLAGCSRQHYRVKADKEVYSLMESGGTRDCRWKLDDYRIDVNPKSRMYDRHNPDKEPMPSDDASAHVKMHKVGGMKGSKHWHDNGRTKFVENPCWRQHLLYNENGAVPLNMDGAVELALLHSPEYQSALENLYLSAASVSQERFRLDTQFYGGDSLFYTANGRLRGGDTSLVNDADIAAQKLFATGGEMVVGLANSITWTFNGQNSWYADSIFNVGFVQPILRAAGRKVVLENLTQAERDFLASIRQMVYFQQGFYTQIVTGTGSQAAPSGGISISLPSLGGGYYGLLAHQIRIQNTRQNIIGLEENLRRLEELFAANQIEDVFQVEQTRQGLFDSESLLLTQIKSYQDNVETYLRSLGLPPDLKVEINDPVMEQFQLMSPTITVLQEDIGLLLSDMRKKDQPLPNDFPVRIENIIKRTQSEINILDNDLVALEKAVPERVAGLRALEAGLAEQIRQGERIESAIYDADIFAKRIQTLREVEVPANYARLEAVFYLLQWTLATGETELRPMIEADTFLDTLPADVLKAMRVLRLIDDGQAGIPALPVDMAAKQEEIRKAQQELESLKKLVENERQTQAENSISFDAATSTSTALTPKGTNTVVVAEKTSGEPMDAQQVDAKLIIEELRQEDKYRDWLHDLLTEFQNEVATLSIAQVKTRLDAVNLLPTSLSETDALKMAEENRLDWMNRRAALVDSWRQIEIAANKLKGDLNVRVEGEIGTIDQRGVRFDNDDSRLRVGLEWDSPLTRHTEMMDYRRSQIAYQAARRDYYTYVDSVDAELRNLLRELRLTQVDFEIRRNAILIAAKQVDVAQLNLIKPAERGTPIDSNTATRVIDSLARMSSTQNSFIDAWVNYQTSRMLLDMSLGTMELDKQGRWIDPGQITKDRLGPVARNGGKNAVPGGTHGNSRGLTPSKRKHQQRRGAKNLIEAAPHEIPPAPRLGTETKNVEPTLAPDENVAGILEVNAETESEVPTEQIVAEIVPLESAPPAPKTTSNKALKPSMPKPVLRLTPCEAVTTPDIVPNNNGPDKMSDNVNAASSETVSAQVAGTRPRFRPAPLPPQSPE